MRKKIAIIVVMIIMLCSFAGCGVEKRLEKETNRIMKGIQNWDDLIQKEIIETAKGTITSDSNGVEAEEIEKVFVEYWSENAKLMTYEIKDVDTEKLEVKISCTYVDGTMVATEFYTSLLGMVLLNAFDDETKIDNANIVSAFQKSVATEKEKTFTTEDIVLTFEEDGSKYKLKEGYKDLYKVMTSNFSEIFDNETKENHEDLAKNVIYEVEDSASGAGVFVTNKNAEAVSVDFDVLFQNKNGEMLESNSSSIDCIAPGETQFVGIEAYSVYDSSDVQINVTSTNNNVAKNIVVEDNAVKEGVMVKITNQEDKNLASVSASIVFYEGERMIGFSNNSEYNVKAGQYVSFMITNPYEKESYTDIPYDNYKVFAQAYLN